jgi:hypothetical protein
MYGWSRAIWRLPLGKLLMKSGEIKPVFERSYPAGKTADTLRQVEGGRPEATLRYPQGRGPLLSERSQVTQNRRNQLRHSRMNVHAALEHRVGRSRVHHVKDAVNGLIAPGSKNRRAENLL